MKTLAIPKFVFFALTTLAGFIASAQDASLASQKTLALQVSLNQTVSVRFPEAITSVDRGSSQLLAKKAPTVENVLLLKAGSPDMPPTSLMVILSDGSLHSFQVQFSSGPVPIGLELLSDTAPGAVTTAQLSGQQPLIRHEMGKAQGMPRNLRVKASTQGIKARIDGFYIAGDRIYLRLSLANHSVIGYDLASVALYLQDKAQPKRTAAQQKQIIPLLPLPKQNTIASGGQLTVVIPLPKLTIDRRKYLAVQIHENTGSRNISIRLKASHFRKMKAL
ncbi:DUF4138 domain-containing protein [Dyadobacter pollutisoli]|uniref:DUF4138 domain-containing protein n=1 Tax=Dyadobacter pollutisoli TaxID=2910158 RepID=A0A9E8NB04_9BACT|nr:DUF4138 domain-containing protein [Dyadobacter pollutisoli]WAC13250.1 DUF4138 domain-containing protein [Dyadobacter pollutisoli]